MLYWTGNILRMKRFRTFIAWGGEIFQIDFAVGIFALLLIISWIGQEKSYGSF